MSGNISVRNGVAEVMVVGEPAWHRLGTVLDNPVTAEQAIEAAHLNWTVSKQPVFIGKRGLLAETRRYHDCYAIVRDDDWCRRKVTALGFAGEDYTPLQNREAFSFFDPIVGENAAVYHTAGALGDGKRVWILAKLPDNIHLVGDDITEKFLLLSNSHDGSGAVEVRFTPIRVVCQNTLMMAMCEGPSLRIAHTSDVRERLVNAGSLLNTVRAGYRQIEGSFHRMTRVPLGGREVLHYLEQVFPEPKRTNYPDDESYERALAWAHADRAGAEYFFQMGKGNGLRGVARTLWAAYNGVTEYVDHRRYAKTTGDEYLEAIWFGSGYSIKARAYAVAGTFVTATENAHPSRCQEELRTAG